MRISDWSSDVCSPILGAGDRGLRGALRPDAGRAAGTVHRIFPVPTLPAAGTRLRFGGGAMTPFDRDAVRSFRFVRCEFDAGTGIARLVYAFDDGPELVETIRSEEHTSELQSLMRISY